MVQNKIFGLSPKTPRLSLTRKSQENSPTVVTPPGTNNIFATTHQYHKHPPFTGQWYLTSTQKLDIGSLSLSLQSVILCDDQAVNLGRFHNNM